MSLQAYNYKNESSARAFDLCWEAEVRRHVCLCAVAPGCPARSVWEESGFLRSFLISKNLSDDVASCYVEMSFQ